MLRVTDQYSEISMSLSTSNFSYDLLESKNYFAGPSIDLELFTKLYIHKKLVSRQMTPDAKNLQKICSDVLFIREYFFIRVRV